jgi:hypothetical protein
MESNKHCRWQSGGCRPSGIASGNLRARSEINSSGGAYPSFAEKWVIDFIEEFRRLANQKSRGG